jgi:hypothetical protein
LLDIDFSKLKIDLFNQGEEQSTLLPKIRGREGFYDQNSTMNKKGIYRFKF